MSCIPDETMLVTAGPAASGALSVLPWTAEPNILVTHGEWRGLERSLLKQNSFVHNFVREAELCVMIDHMRGW